MEFRRVIFRSKRFVRITIAAVLGAQVVFWIAVVLWLNLRPQVPEDPEQRAREMEVGNIIVVKMNDSLRFVPTEITIKAGDTVEWRNVGVVPHTVTADPTRARSEEHTSELQSLMRISYAVFCLKKKTQQNTTTAQNKQ